MLAIIAALLAVIFAPTLLILLARLVSESPQGAIDEVMALSNVSMTDRLAAVSCFHRAREAERRTWLYDALAPQAVALALLFTRRDAERLPRLFSKWDNNVSLNGDGEGVLRDGKWLTRGHDIGWADPLLPGDKLFRYSDPDYGGDAYYARGHHPRSYWARWVWCGWRNRASQLSKTLGVEISQRPEVISGSPDVGRTKPGHVLYRSGVVYHYHSFKPVGRFVRIRNYGAKLGYVFYSASGTGRVPYIAIGRSWKGRKK